MRLRNPEFLFLLLIWIPMVWVYFRRERHGRAALRFSDLSIPRTLGRTLVVKLRHIPFGFRLLGIGLLVVALARPQKGNTEEEITTHGVDIILALDVSTSMKALDFKPQNRLHVAKETIKEFVGKRQHDRIGLVVFAGRSFTKCPLTLDYGILTDFIDELEFGQIEDGTAIGTAIATAANRIKESSAKSKVIILLTDGENNRGEITPTVAAEAAGELDIKIYTIGVGKKGRIPYPFERRDMWTGKTKTTIETIESQLDEGTLKEIAEITNGEYFRAHNTEELQEIYDQINTLEKTEIKTKSYTTYSERFFPWLLAGFAFLMLELILVNTRFRRIP
jgi:Ca-activated chloride channel family protein